MSTAEQLVGLLARSGRTLAVAESLTGGAVCDALVEVPGASGCLRGGVVAYAADLKTSLLGVAPELLEQHGAVHPDVAVAMARGVRERLGADFGTGTTGVAGPGPQDGHAPGTFHVAVCGPDGSVRVRSAAGQAAGPATSRAGVRRAARDAALDLTLALVAATQPPHG